MAYSHTETPKAPNPYIGLSDTSALSCETLHAAVDDDGLGFRVYRV